jgi:uridine phosphorylase
MTCSEVLYAGDRNRMDEIAMHSFDHTMIDAQIHMNNSRQRGNREQINIDHYIH